MRSTTGTCLNLYEIKPKKLHTLSYVLRGRFFCFCYNHMYILFVFRHKNRLYGSVNAITFAFWNCLGKGLDVAASFATCRTRSKSKGSQFPQTFKFVLMLHVRLKRFPLFFFPQSIFIHIFLYFFSCSFLLELISVLIEWRTATYEILTH